MDPPCAGRSRRDAEYTHRRHRWDCLNGQHAAKGRGGCSRKRVFRVTTVQNSKRRIYVNLEQQEMDRMNMFRYQESHLLRHTHSTPSSSAPKSDLQSIDLAPGIPSSIQIQTMSC